MPRTGPADPPTSLLTDALQPVVAEPPSTHGGSDALAGHDQPEATRVMGSASAGPVPPSDLGHFTRLKVHAQGGVGQISLARDELLGRTVALKELRCDRTHSEDARQRFLNEATITSQLEHPGIVPIYSMAYDDRGQPYYTMQFIQGKTLADAIAKYHKHPDRPGLRALLQRFISVCQTMAYAHEHGVIHRDLKPANIMLGEFGETLVLDWGLAKQFEVGSMSLPSSRFRLVPKSETPLTDSIISDASYPPPLSELSTQDSGLGGVKKPRTGGGSEDDLTQEGEILGTPAFMSPEQASGEVAKLGPATDIYALGGCLYQILTNTPPFGGLPVFELLFAVQQGRLVPPSKRGGKVPRTLEAICLKAMAKEVGDRYPSAKALAADIDHWLGDEPVSVKRESWPLRVGRYLRRHQTAAGLVLVFLVTGMVALLINTFQMGQANDSIRQERDVAERARALAVAEGEKARTAEGQARQAQGVAQAKAEESEAVLNFLIFDMFSSAMPASGGYQFTVKEAMDNAAAKLPQAFGKQPVLQARLDYALGTVYKALGEYQVAEVHARRAVALAEQHLSPDAWLRRLAREALADVLREKGHLVESERLFRELLAEREPVALTTGERLEYVRVKLHFIELLVRQRKFAEAGPLIADTEAYLLALPPSARRDRYLKVHLTSNRANLLLFQKKYAEALAEMRVGYEHSRDAYGPNHPGTLQRLHNVGMVMFEAGDCAEAERLLNEVVTLTESKCGPNHEFVLATRMTLCAIYIKTKQLAKAEPLTLDVLTRIRQHFPNRADINYKAIINRATVLTGLGRFAEATALVQEASRLEPKSNKRKP